MVNAIGIGGGILLWIAGSGSYGEAMPIGELLQAFGFVWFVFFLLVSLI